MKTSVPLGLAACWHECKLCISLRVAKRTYVALAGKVLAALTSHGDLATFLVDLPVSNIAAPVAKLADVPAPDLKAGEPIPPTPVSTPSEEKDLSDAPKQAQAPKAEAPKIPFTFSMPLPKSSEAKPASSTGGAFGAALPTDAPRGAFTFTFNASLPSAAPIVVNVFSSVSIIEIFSPDGFRTQIVFVHRTNNIYR